MGNKLIQRYSPSLKLCIKKVKLRLKLVYLTKEGLLVLVEFNIQLQFRLLRLPR